MTIRKFGRSDDQRVSLDLEEDELARRTASTNKSLTDEDREAILRESAEQ